MAITLETAARNAAADAVTALVDAGTPPGDVAIRDASNNILCTIEFLTEAFGPATNGVCTADCDPALTSVGLAAAGAGTAATNYIVRNAAGTTIWSGTVTATGAGGDMTLDNVSIAEDQVVNVTGFTFTMPATVA
jgi:hypothetical protein